jgi:hypothetical protein
MHLLVSLCRGLGIVIVSSTFLFVPQPSSGINFGVCLVMMLADGLLYCALGWYCDKVTSLTHHIRLTSSSTSYEKLIGRNCSLFIELVVCQV